MIKEAAAFAPATVANLGPGFDWLGCAVEGDGDTVVATVLPDRPGEVVVESIEGDNGRLSLVAAENCAGIGAAEVLKLLPGSPSCGVSLRLNFGKGGRWQSGRFQQGRKCPSDATTLKLPQVVAQGLQCRFPMLRALGEGEGTQGMRTGAMGCWGASRQRDGR